MLYGFFPSEQTEVESTKTIVHVIAIALLTTLAHSCLDTSSFSVIFQICDKRVAGVYITLLATIANLSSYIHKLYIFAVVERFGLFWPQAVISLGALAFALLVRERIARLDELPKESWAVSDSIL